MENMARKIAPESQKERSMSKTRRLYHFSIASHGASNIQIAELLRAVAKEIEDRPYINLFGLTMQDINDDTEQPSITIYYDRDPKDSAPEEYSMNATTVGPMKNVTPLLASLVREVDDLNPKDVYDITFDAKLIGRSNGYSITLYSE